MTKTVCINIITKSPNLNPTSPTPTAKSVAWRTTTSSSTWNRTSTERGAQCRRSTLKIWTLCFLIWPAKSCGPLTGGLTTAKCKSKIRLTLFHCCNNRLLTRGRLALLKDGRGLLMWLLAVRIRMLPRRSNKLSRTSNRLLRCRKREMSTVSRSRTVRRVCRRMKSLWVRTKRSSSK